MRPAPRIARECGADRILRLGLDRVRRADLASQRPSEDDEAVVDEPARLSLSSAPS
jgi:hypothetical protein